MFNPFNKKNKIIIELENIHIEIIIKLIFNYILNLKIIFLSYLKKQIHF